MTRLAHRHWTTRLALWAAVCALLLKAAAPMLATASAELQGKTLVEVCTVYGVATVVLDAAGEGAPAPADSTAAHSTDHCALTGLLALAVTEPLVSAWPSVQRAQAPPPPPAGAHAVPDAQTRWAARLKHGPPALA